MRPHPINGEFILTVYRDYINSNGQWRLFWEDINRPNIGLPDSDKFFKTRKDARAYAMKHYGEFAYYRTV